MKALVISNLYPPDMVGGYEMGCRQAVDALRRRGHEVRVLTSAPRTPVASPPHVRRMLQLTDLWDPHIKGYLTPAAFQQAESDSLRVSSFNVHALLTELEAFKPDVVYLWMLTGIGGLGLVGCLQHLGVPWVWHLMDEVPCALCSNEYVVSPHLAREFNRRIGGSYLACSQQLVDRIERLGTKLNDEVEVIPNWTAGPCSAPRTKFYRGGMLRIVSAAALIDRFYDKGMDLLITAAALLRERGLDRFTLDIYGKVTDNHYGNMVRSHRLDQHVRLAGSLTQDELIAGFGDYDVFAFPGRLGEPCAFAPLEAAPSGCVPIMSTICGNAEWFVHSVHCLKVPRTAEGFAHALGAVMEGKVDLEPIARRLASLGRHDFHLDTLVVRIEHALERATRKPRVKSGTSDEAYRLALLAEKLSQVLIQEPYLAASDRDVSQAPAAVPAGSGTVDPSTRRIDPTSAPTRPHANLRDQTERTLAVTTLASHDTTSKGPSRAGDLLALGGRIARRILRATPLQPDQRSRPIHARLARVEALAQSAHLKGDAAHEKSDDAHAQLDNLTRRLDRVEELVQATVGFHWDHVALVRRLAELEDRFIAQPDTAPPAVDGEAKPSIPFPGWTNADRRRDEEVDPCH